MEEESNSQQQTQNPYLNPQWQARKQLRVTDVLHAIGRRAILIVVLTIVGLVIGIVLSVLSYMRGEMSKQYAITTSIAVTSQNQNGLFTAQSSNPNSADIYLAESMVDSVIYVLKSDQTLNAAVNKLELLGISARDINRNLNMVQYKETQIVEITLYWRSAQEGVEILNAINEVAPDILIQTLKLGNVSVINEPTAKYLIGGNINANVWGYMAVLGLMMGVGIAVLELLVRPTLLKTSDMETTFGVEVLGEIPQQQNYFKKKHNLLLDDEEDLPNAALIDNYVSLAHIVKARLSKMDHPCVYVTSASQNEGKTTVTAYLSVQLAELGMKVLVVDFDTRNPKLGGMFLNKVDYPNSINALYRGETNRQTAITHLTGNLDVLPAVLERRPLAFDDALLNLIWDLKRQYDVILLDTAPVGQVADTMSLNRLADVALLVTRFDGSGMETIRDALARLDKSGMRIMGCVVNRVKNLGRIDKSAYGYGYGYGYGYHGSGQQRARVRKTEQQLEWERWEKEHAAAEAEKENASALTDSLE